MATQLNAELLAQMANDQIEVNEVANILDGMYDEMPCDEPENRDYMRLFAANRLGKANDSEISKFKKAIIGLLQRPNDHSPRTFHTRASQEPHTQTTCAVQTTYYHR